MLSGRPTTNDRRRVCRPYYHYPVDLPVNPPILPMLAKRVAELPDGDDWIFEPKWDGFRALVFRDGDEIFIQSRDEKPLDRYFPELLEPLQGAASRAMRARRRDRHRSETTASTSMRCSCAFTRPRRA